MGGSKVFHFKIIELNTGIINSAFQDNQNVFNNIELSGYSRMLRVPHLSPQVGLGVGVYLPCFMQADSDLYAKMSLDLLWFKNKSFSTGFFIDYMISNRAYNAGLSVKYPIVLKSFNKRSISLGLRSDITYNSYLNNWLLAFSLGFNFNKRYEAHYKKPVLYFYSSDTLDLDVELIFDGNLTFTWPEYNDFWSITVLPNSEIIDRRDSKKYNYLFWEGNYQTPNKDTINSGYIVLKDDLPYFFEDKLSVLGLNAREINDFITYWAPMLNESQYFIHFMIDENCEQIAKYRFSKSPDTFIRVIALFMKVPENSVTVVEQQLDHHERDGFTIVEWGGAEI